MKYIRHQTPSASSEIKYNSFRQRLFKVLAFSLKRNPARLLILVSGFITAAIAAQFASAVLRGLEESQSTQPAAVVAPISVNKSATIDTDNNGNGHVNPGDVIEYSVTVGNGGTTASGVIFHDVLSSDLTLVPGSTKAAPVAGDDSYQTIGNTQLQVAASQTISAPGIFVAGSVLSNDNDPNGGTLTASLGTVTAGANVTMNSDGTFIYTPPPGFTGTDTFTYNLADSPNNGFTAAGTVSITVTNFVWYVRNNAPAGGNGTSSNPFNTLLAAQNATPAGGTIYVFEGDGTTTNQNSGVTLDANQRLIGAGIALTVPVAVNDGPNPTVLRAATSNPLIGGTITLNNTNSANTLQGFTANGAATISGTNFGGLTVDTVTINSTAQALNLNNGTIGGTGFTSTTSSGGTNNVSLVSLSGTLNLGAGALSGATGNSFEIGSATAGSGGNVMVNYSGTITSQSGGGKVVSVRNKTGGTVALSGAVTGNFSGTGILLDTNPGATITFSGGLTLSTGNGNAFDVKGGGTVNVTGSTNDVTSTTGIGISIANTSIGVSGVAFRNVTVSGAATNGVILNTTSGSFTVSGTTNLGTAGGSGTSGVSINIVNYPTGTISFGVVNINRRGNTGIHINNFDGTAATFGAITIPNQNNAGGYGIRLEESSAAILVASANISNAKQVTGQTDPNNNGLPDSDGDGDAIFMKNNTGSFTLNGPSSLTNCGNDCIDVRSSQNMTLSNVTIDSPGLDAIGANTSGEGGHGIQAINLTGTNTFTNSTVTDWETQARDGLRWWNTTGTATLTLHGCTFSDSAAGSNAILYNGDGNSTMTLNVGGTSPGQLCTFSQVFGAAITHNAGFNGGSTSRADLNVINNSFIGTPNGGQNSVSSRNGASGRAITVITGNTFDGVGKTLADTSGVIDLGADATDTSAVANGNFIHFTVTNNIIKNIGTSAACLAPASSLECHGKRGIDVFIDDNSIIGNDGNPTIDGDDAIIISGNVITNLQRSGIMFDVGQVFNGSNFAAKVLNNRVGIDANNAIARVGVGDALAPAGEWAMLVENRNQNGKDLNILIQNNLFYNGNGGSGSALNNSGMLFRSQRSATLTGTVTGNTFNVNTSSTSYGVHVGTVNTGSPSVCFDASGNSISAPGGGFALTEAVGDLNVEQSQADLSSLNGGASTSILTGAPDFGVACSAPPAFAKLSEENRNITINYSNSDLSFLNSSSQSLFEKRTTIESIVEHSANSETVSTNKTITFIKAGTQAIIENTAFADYKESAGLAASQNQPSSGNFDNAIYRLASALYSAAKYFALFDFIPTVHAEETESSALMAGETICVDGDTTSALPCNGPGFNLPPNKSTTIKFRATVNASTTATSVSNTATAGGQNSNMVTTPIVQPAAITKSFSPTSVAVNGTSTLTLSITNPNPTNLTGVSVTDSFPSGLQIAATPMLTTSGCGAGTITDPSNGALGGGDAGIKINNATVANATACVITVKVTPTTEGDKINTTGTVSSTEGGTGLSATATLGAVAAPSFTKNFAATNLAVGDATTLTFTITNNSSTTSLTGVSFTDTLPAGMVVATPVNLSGSCGTGTITANAGAGTIQLAGATLATSASCSLTVDVTATSAGTKNNTVDLTTNQTGTGPTATDSLYAFVKPDIFVRDARVSEPSTGATNMVFTVTLSEATPQTVSVNFTTAPDTGGANPATAGADYTTTTGTVTFMPGQRVKTISVPVPSDGSTPAETDETLLVNLSGATGGDITDGQAVGTITQGSTPGAVLISELRTSGAGGAGDDYVEIYNNSDSPLTVAASDASAGWALVASNNGCSDDPVIVGVIPNATIIPARGHYLLTGSQYSLANYGGTNAALGNVTMTEDLDADSNVALFTTADLAQLSSVNRLDAVGFGLNTPDICDLLREGSTLSPVSGSTSEYAFVRKYDEGSIVHTNNNQTDFVLVSTTPSTPVGSSFAMEGAPGPQNTGSPVDSQACLAIGIERNLLDSSLGESASPNVVRDAAPVPMSPTSLQGMLSFRRRIENNTGAPLTRLRFRITDLTTFQSPGPTTGTADLRAITSSDVPSVTITNDSESCGGPTSCTVTVKGTSLETPPAQPNGGGVNSTLSMILGTPLSPGQSVNVQLVFGVQQVGDYNLDILIEGLPSVGGQQRWTLEGNTETANSHTETGCNEPPDTTIDSSPSNPSNSGSASFTFSGTDSDGTVASFECKLDMGSFTACTSPQNYSSLADGAHTFQVRAIDNLGAVDASPDSFTWTIDTAAPDTTINTSPPNPSTANVSFTFSGNDGSGTGVAGFECKLDSGTFASCTSQQAYNSLADGSHTFEVRAIDGAGNVDATPASYMWTVDATPPDTTINSNPTNLSNSSSASFTFSGSDTGGSGVASFECKLDAGSFAACTSPQTYNNLSDGSHIFEVRAIDNAGNTDASPASYTWVVDTTAPDTTIAANPTNPSSTSSASFSFTGNDGTGTGVSSFECQLDGGGFSTCTSPQSYNSLTDGSHTFQVRAVDNAGSTDSTPSSFTWTVDTVAPDTIINSTPSNTSNSTSASFTFSGTDSGTGVVSFECKLDMGSFAACTSPRNYTMLSNGSHTFEVRAIDNIGNVDPSPASYAWTVDTVSPSVTINQAAGQSDPANGMGISIRFTAVFNEPVTGFGNSLSDVTLSGTAGATSFTVTEIGPMNGTTYNVSLSGMTMAGTVTADIPAGAAQDAAINPNTASTSMDNTVTYVPNTPPVANPDSYSTTQDTPHGVAAPGVLGNDSDSDAGNMITALLVAGPSKAQSFTLSSDGSFNYNPNPSFTGTDSFTYKARDNFNAESAAVTVTISVKYRFDWVSNGMLGGSFTQQGLNQVTAGSNVALRFTLYGYKGDPYSQPPTSQQINCATSAPIGAATTIMRFTPDPFYSSYFDFYQTTWLTQTSWKFTCRQLTLHFNDGTTQSLKFYFK
jgi:uncharacterized repeat protein (TIGR01451 family)